MSSPSISRGFVRVATGLARLTGAAAVHHDRNPVVHGNARPFFGVAKFLPGSRARSGRRGIGKNAFAGLRDGLASALRARFALPKIEFNRG